MKVSSRLSDYATPEEITAAIVTLEDLWRRYVREMDVLQRTGSPLYQQPGEDGRAYFHRCFAMSDSELDIAARPGTLKVWRHCIHKLIASLREDRIPKVYSDMCFAGEDAAKVVQPFLERFDAAFQAADAAEAA